MTTSENIEQPETAQPEQFDSVGADSSAPEKNWFYAAGGQNQGAYTEQQMLNFITATIIAPTTSVWSGEGEWIAAKDSSLAHAFPKPPTDVPPPLKADDVDNRIIWLVVAVPIVGMLIEFSFNKSLVWVYWILNIAICVWDDRKLKQAGHESPDVYWSLLVPAYLWKRAEILGQKKYYLWAWIAAFILSIFISYGATQNELESTSCELVTQIMHENYEHSRCVGVSVGKEVYDNFYRGTATLDDGRDIDITIQRRDDKIYVKIPQQ